MTNNSPAHHALRFMLDQTPFHVRSVVAPIWHNFNGTDDQAWAKVRQIFVNTRDEDMIYAAATYAQDMIAAA